VACGMTQLQLLKTPRSGLKKDKNA